MTPIRMNPDFTPGMHSIFLSDGWPHPNIQAGQFFLNNRILSQTDLADKFNKVSFPFWTFVQLRNFLLKPNPKPDWTRNRTTFEKWCNSREPLKHLISSTYALLFSNHSPKINWANQLWEADLSLDLSNSE